MSEGVGQVGAVGVVVARVDQRVKKPDNRINLVKNSFFMNLGFLLTYY